jgi:hypothetical protein
MSSPAPRKANLNAAIQRPKLMQRVEELEILGNQVTLENNRLHSELRGRLQKCENGIATLTQRYEEELVTTGNDLERLHRLEMQQDRYQRMLGILSLSSGGNALSQCSGKVLREGFVVSASMSAVSFLWNSSPSLIPCTIAPVLEIMGECAAMSHGTLLERDEVDCLSVYLFFDLTDALSYCLALQDQLMTPDRFPSNLEKVQFFKTKLNARGECLWRGPRVSMTVCSLSLGGAAQFPPFPLKGVGDPHLRYQKTLTKMIPEYSRGTLLTANFPGQILVEDSVMEMIQEQKDVPEFSAAVWTMVTFEERDIIRVPSNGTQISLIVHDMVPKRYKERKNSFQGAQHDLQMAVRTDFHGILQQECDKVAARQYHLERFNDRLRQEQHTLKNIQSNSQDLRANLFQRAGVLELGRVSEFTEQYEQLETQLLTLQKQTETVLKENDTCHYELLQIQQQQYRMQMEAEEEKEKRKALERQRQEMLQKAVKEFQHLRQKFGDSEKRMHKIEEKLQIMKRALSLDLIVHATPVADPATMQGMLTDAPPRKQKATSFK